MATTRGDLTDSEDGEGEGSDAGGRGGEKKQDGGGTSARPGGDESGSDSEQSEIGWEAERDCGYEGYEGPLGGEKRLWSRAEVDGALLLLRRVQCAAPRAERGAGAAGRGGASAAAQGDGGYPGGDGGGDDAAVPTPTYGLGISAALVHNGGIASTDAQLDRRLAEVLRQREPKLAVCALRSGHFAGAVFHGPEPVVHKAIHRYTVRAKAGGAQSTMDNSGRAPKSAGSSLRRYGETRLAEEVKELMSDKWSTELAGCEIIFVSVSRRMRATLLGPERAPFVPNANVRRLPFMVGKPTFEAIREAHLKVACVAFAEAAIADALVAKFRPAPAAQADAGSSQPAAGDEKKAPGAAQEAPRPKYVEEEDELYTALHVAAAAGDEELIQNLLDEGADPTARDGKGRVPYYVCVTQKAREAFRRWRGQNEDDWDWLAAQVPEAITDGTDQKKKEKEKEKNKKKKDKLKAAKVQLKVEEDERTAKEAEEARLLQASQAKCDSCGKPLVSKPFARLEYLYCNTECVAAHRRALQAEAAMRRMSGAT